MRFLALGRHCAARPSLRQKRCRLGRPVYELLEARALLSATPHALVAAPFADAATPAITIIRDGAVFEEIAPADTDVDRGNALRAALAAAVDGDELVLGAYTFDMGSQEHVEFPDRVTVDGAGKELTRITSSCPQGTDGAATFTLNNETNLEDLWLEGSLTNGLYQPLVGIQGGPVEDVIANLRRLKITGDSDGIFIWTGPQFDYTINAYDCEINTRYDAVAVLGSGLNPQSVFLYNCSLTVGQPSSIPLHISNAVNLQSGFVGLYNCTVTALGDENSVQTAGVWVLNQGTAEVVNSTFNVGSPSGPAFDLFIQDDRPVTVMGGSGSGPGGAFTSSTGTEIYQTAPASQIVGRSLFYSNSGFDAEGDTAHPDDSAAIAPDVVALTSGQATFANVSSYSKGINGIMIDVAGFHGAITADDFRFRVGLNDAIDQWVDAPAPLSITVWGGEGVGGSDRVEIVWADGQIVNEWLQITVLPGARTGLAQPDVFYFGNRVGDTGPSDSAEAAITNITDLNEVRTHVGILHSIVSPFDFNRDGIVNVTDVNIARNNSGVLIYITIAPPQEAGDDGGVALPAAMNLPPAASHRSAPLRRFSAGGLVWTARSAG